MQKVITTDIRTQIHDFSKLISSTEGCILHFKKMVKALATARDKFDKHFRT